MPIKLFDSTDQMISMLQNNEPRRVVAGQTNICVVRQGSTMVAFKNECPHMGEGLSGGKVNYLGEIVCPLHTYKFNLKTGEEERRRCGDLVFIRVITSEEGVFLDI